MYVVVMSTGNGITTKVASFHDAYLPDIPPKVTEYGITVRTSCETVGVRRAVGVESPRRRSPAQYRLPGRSRVPQKKLQRTRAAIDVFLDGEEQVRAARGGDGNFLPAERHAGKSPPVLLHREPEVAAPRPDAGDRGDADVRQEEQRLFVPDAEGAQAVEIGQQVGGDLVEPKFRVDRPAPNEGGLPRVAVGDLRKTLPEGVEVTEGEGEAGRLRVPAVPRQEVGKAGQGRHDVESLDAAARAFGRAVLLLEQHDRASVPFQDLGGDDPEHPGVPGGVRQNDRRRDLPRRREDGFHGDDDPLLLPLPQRVVLVQLPGKAPGIVPGFRHEDPGAARRVSDPAGGVQARPDPETEIRLRRNGVRHARGLEQRFDSRAGRLADLPEPLPDEEPVSTPKGRHVGNRSQGDQVEVLPQRRFREERESADLPHRLAQCAHEQEGDPHARHLLPGERAIGLHRVHDGEGLRDGIARKVMIRHDHLDPLPGRLAHGSDIGDPAVDRHDEAEPIPRGGGEHVRLQAVTVLPAVVLVDPHGKIGEDPLQEEVETGGAGGAVGVVVGVDQHRFVARPGRRDAARRLVDILEEGRVGEIGECPAEEPFDVTRFHDPAVHEHLRRRGGQAMTGGQLPDGVRVGGSQDPLPLRRPLQAAAPVTS
jgi:hypothetical protein